MEMKKCNGSSVQLLCPPQTTRQTGRRTDGRADADKQMTSGGASGQCTGGGGGGKEIRIDGWMNDSLVPSLARYITQHNRERDGRRKEGSEAEKGVNRETDDEREGRREAKWPSDVECRPGAADGRTDGRIGVRPRPRTRPTPAPTEDDDEWE